ncbi:fructose-1-phosphate kinase [Lentibacillus jeotgali]|uniref:fructose-1-phosphate kinase n=1 Tax=Lentibacillus jeotgali TaxID=558169 RepID=UPI0002625878|nr:fructose-1-phosphate kinase [Lentibacillus jeotgali]
MQKNKQNWPEKYAIDKLVTIQKDIQKIISGEKTSVRRNDRYADPGDKFELNGHTVIVEDVYPQKLGEVTNDDAQQEGYGSLKEYINSITKIHGEKVWDPHLIVWAHILKPV